MSDRHKIEGTSGPDNLTGSIGDDDIRGRQGDDTIAGRDGDDRLRGDKGDDLLTGNDGRDRFIFNLQGGDDTVTDFADGQDRLDFTNFHFASAQQLLDHAEQVGSDVVFTLDGGETVTLDNVKLAALDASDFLI